MNMRISDNPPPSPPPNEQRKAVLTTRIKGKVTKLADRHTGRRSTPKRRTKKIHTNATKSCILRSWLPNVHGDEASIVVTPDTTTNRNRIHKTKDFRLHYSFGTVEAPTSPTDNDGRQRVASSKVNGNQAKAAARSSTPSLDHESSGNASLLPVGGTASCNRRTSHEKLRPRGLCQQHDFIRTLSPAAPHPSRRCRPSPSDPSRCRRGS
jgi:hypothetical protein